MSRWDTCAAEAIIAAHGGVLGKLDALLDEAHDGDDALPAYTYAQSDTNRDFVPRRAHLSRYNASKAAPKDAVESGALASDVAHVKPYSNLSGLVALRARADLPRWRAAARVAASKEAPQYN